MCVTNCYDMTLALNVASKPNTTNQLSTLRGPSWLSGKMFDLQSLVGAAMKSSEFFEGVSFGKTLQSPTLVLGKPRKDMNNVSCCHDMTEILLKNTIQSINLVILSTLISGGAEPSLAVDGNGRITHGDASGYALGTSFETILRVTGL